MIDIEKRKQYLIEYRKNNKQKAKEYRENNKKKSKEYHLEYYKINKIKFKKNNLNYYKKNQEKIIYKTKEYYKKNKKICNERAKIYIQNRIKNDNIFKLKNTLRCRIYSIFKYKRLNKNNTTKNILGCEFETAKNHLQNKFIDGMNWENHGEWHIDHIIPLASAKTEDELLKLCHYTNLQPLWALDNLIKGDKIL